MDYKFIYYLYINYYIYSQSIVKKYRMINSEIDNDDMYQYLLIAGRA